MNLAHVVAEWASSITFQGRAKAAFYSDADRLPGKISEQYLLFRKLTEGLAD